MTSTPKPRPLPTTGKDITITPEERTELEATGHHLLEALTRAEKEGGLHPLHVA